MGRVIFVTSFKGGVGKTTLSANLSSVLARMGHKVLAVDGDFGMRCLDMALGLESDVIYDINDAINDAITEMLNNYYTKQEIDNFFSNFSGGGTGTGGGGIFAMGEGNFRNGNIANTKTTITLIPAAPSADYYVSITPDEDTLAEVGVFWVDTANQNENGFDVYNTGLGITGFKWAVTLRSLPT
ncbi:MAG: hypothetical protein EOM87_07150, partial [Clostridia bacterium]|nr:hypothetical protein [Clostridia bacterium]